MSVANIKVDLVKDESELEQILQLQRRNLTYTEDGFVTVRHTLDILRSFHAAMPSVVAKQDDTVIGYAISMPRDASKLVPVLEPMFRRLDGLAVLENRRWYVMGQVCIDQDWRGCGVFDGLYLEHRRRFSGRFQWLVTEISMRNRRSQRAHQRVGFIEIDHYRDPQDEWSVVGLQLA